MEVHIQEAVLHILDAEGGTAVYSQKELDLAEESVYNFMVMHIKKLYQDDTAKRGEFRSDSQFLDLCRGEDAFLEKSTAIAARLFAIMRQSADIPCADLLVAKVTADEVPYLAVIKFNYKQGYTHYVDYNNAGTNNKIIVHKVIFASESQKNEEGVLVNLQDFSLLVVEKPYPVNGEKQYYFSNLYLECETDLSTRESFKVINEVAKDISERYYNGNFQKVSEVKAAIHDCVETAGNVQIETIAQNCFKDSPAVRQEYLTKVKEAGVPEKISIVGDAPERKFNKHKIKTDSGIEISMPMEVYKNKDMVEFLNNPDGTIAIVLKNINQIVSK